MEFEDCEKYDDPNHVFYLDCDILVPAALEEVIHKDNVEKIKAKIIAEGANGPLTYEADEYLSKNSVLILPDLFLNSQSPAISAAGPNNDDIESCAGISHETRNPFDPSGA